MESMSLTSLAAEHLEGARSASSGRSAHTIHGGHDHPLRQTVIALAGGQGLDEHESPGEATLQVLTGRVRLDAGEESAELTAGEYVVIPPRRHSLAALEDSVVLLTVVASGVR
ncbi:cupin domain-containing protein [Nocardioides insulae]|uniref:cupin domain-containing protein n=1 Tax=Nocardioides insulae TaxID=394734 RepID=UPI000403BA41|nr:cupin domain-containing protein [Nocardioides insulae]